MNTYNEKADFDYMVLLIMVMFWIVPIYELLMNCQW